MYKVVNIKWEHAETLELKLNRLALEGWVPLFPIWNGEAIVFQKGFIINEVPFPFTHGSAEAETNALAAYEQALMSNDEIEQLREP